MSPCYALLRRRLLGLFAGAAAAALMVGCGAVAAPTPQIESARSGHEALARPSVDKSGHDDAGGPSGTPDHGATPAGFGPTYLIRDRMVTLAGPGAQHHARFSVAIEFASHESASAAPGPSGPSSDLISYTPEYDGYQPVTGGKDSPEKAFQARVKRYVPAMEDAVLTLLSSKTYVEVATADRRESTKREIAARVGSLLHGTDLQVTNAYFTDFVVQ
jgi:hypothetical protein